MNIFNQRNTDTYKPESLKKTQAEVTKKVYLHTEDFFKALLSYYKPEKPHGLPFATRTPRDPLFLDTLIQKQSQTQAQSPLTLETQTQVARAIQSGEFGNPIDDKLVLVIMQKLERFSDATIRNRLAATLTQGLDMISNSPMRIKVMNTIASEITKGTFGIPMDPTLAITFTQKLGLFGSRDRQAITVPLANTIATAISQGTYGSPVDPSTAKTIMTHLRDFSTTEKNLLTTTMTTAIAQGKFGNPITLSMATVIIENLHVFSNRNQESILREIAQGRFGRPLPPDLSVSLLARSLFAIKNKEADQHTRLALTTGIFGDPIDPRVATAIITKLNWFSDTSRNTIAKEMIDGKFGTPIASDVASGIIHHLHLFTPEAKTSLLTAIATGAFGNPMPPDIAIETLHYLGRIYTATEKEAVSKIFIPVITEGLFGNLMEPSIGIAVAQYAHALKHYTMSEREAVKILFKAVLDASSVFKERPMSSDITQAIDETIQTYFTSIASQVSITTAIAEGEFGNPIPTGLSAFMLLNLSIFSNETSRCNVANALLKGVFGNPMDPRFGKLLAQNLNIFSDQAAKKVMITAIDQGLFGSPISETIAEEITTRLSLFDYTDADNSLANAIAKGVFGNPISAKVAKNIFEHLKIFKDAACQNTIVTAITDGVFGKSLSQGLSTVLFDNLEGFSDQMQQTIILSVLKASTSAHTPTHLDNILRKFDLSSDWKSDRLRHITVDSSDFSTSNASLQSYQNIQILTEQLARFNQNLPPRALATAFKPISAQLEHIASQRPADIATVFPGFELLWERVTLLGDHINKLQSTLVERAQLPNQSTPALTDIDTEIKTRITQIKALDINPTSFGSKDQLSQVIRRLEDAVNTLKTEATLSLDQQFDPKHPLGTSVITIDEFTTRYLCEKTGIDLRDCVTENQAVTIQQYDTRDRKILLIYDCSAGREAQFRGWLGDLAFLYKHVVENIKIYDISGEAPLSIEIRDTHHADFQSLPVFMCKALSDCNFDITLYRHKEALNLIFGDEGILNTLKSWYAQDQSKLTLISKMQSIIQACISRGGDSVSIATDIAQDQALKDAINQLCTREQMDPLITKVNTFLKSIEGSSDEKTASYARLGFLFGQLAKQGVLGYHHGNNNTANNLFYTLSATCFEKWGNSAMTDSTREKLLRDLDEGQCIEQVTNSFFIDHPEVAEIWGRV